MKAVGFCCVLGRLTLQPRVLLAKTLSGEAGVEEVEVEDVVVVEEVEGVVVVEEGGEGVEVEVASALVPSKASSLSKE